MSTGEDQRDPPRLRNGVIRRGDTWSYVIRVTSAGGVSKPRWVGGFATETAAKAARDTARVAAARGEFVDRSQITVDTYLTQWLAAHAVEVKPKTHEDYRRMVRTYVCPHIGSVPLQSVRPSTLSGLYALLLARGGRDGGALSVRTVTYVHAVLRKALNDAVWTDQLLASNPALRAKRPRVDAVRPVVDGVWTAEQLRAFLDAARAERLHTFLHLAAYIGARRGELLYLRWQDVHLDDEEAYVFVRGSVSIVAGKRVEGSTKTGRARVVGIDAETVAELRSWRERQNRERRVADGSWKGDDHVFLTELGSQLPADGAASAMHRTIDRYNASSPDDAAPLQRIRLHDLRHTHATLLLKAGVPVHVVAARLGHVDPAITLRVYAHVMRDQASGVAGIFADAVRGGSPNAGWC
ncbi:MAG: tyrosine-type recombinase/integrase [Ornithinimicrobium sp.]